MLKPLGKAIDTFDAVGQMTFLVVTGTALGIGTCWAIGGVATSMIIKKLKRNKINPYS
jgi:nitroreductase